MTYDQLSPETGHLFGEGMDRPPMPPPPPNTRLTMEEVKRLTGGAPVLIGTTPKARRSDPLISHQAASDVAPKVGSREMVVLRVLGERGASNWDQIAEHAGVRASSISPRFKPLREKGLIYDTGRTEAGNSGSNQTVWALTPRGRSVIGLGNDDQLTLMEGP